MAQGQKLKVSEVNTMTPPAFGAAFGRIFEHSPWIAERAFARRPFAGKEALHTAMADVVRNASWDEQLALLRAHPELAGKEAQTGTLTPASTSEQRGVGLTALSREEMARISALNAAHAKKFGFPFIIAVRANTKDTIFREFERRIALSPEAEVEACLEQVFIITRLRIDDLVEE
jgi:2-oxo-4-hydroxy-4-carboxy-5-ureidoimidazoline decarboxylase